MIQLLSLLIAAASIQPSRSFMDLGGGACTFNVSASQNPSKVAGPPEIAERVVFLTQNDSPVEIIWADFTSATLGVSDERFEFSDGHKFKIGNRSDRSLYGVEILGYVGGHTGGIGAGSMWEGELPPGGTAIVKVAGGHGNGGAPGGEVKIILGIESVRFEDCSYWPSRSILRKE